MSVANTITLDQVRPEAVSWLWHGRIPLGKLSVIEGDPGLGKSLVTLDLAARLTTGRAMPDGSWPDINGPAPVVLVTVEDGLSDTIRPRLDLAGADVRLVTAITGVPTSDGYERSIVLPDDWSLVFDVVQQTGAKLLILDPLMALLGGDTNSYRDQDIRRALTPGVMLAETTDAALVVVRHLNKGNGTHAIYRGGGSIGITGAARAVHLIGEYPDDDTRTRRVMAPVKANLAAPCPALSYRVESPDGVDPRIAWEGRTDFIASDLLSAVSTPKQPTPEREDIVDVLDASDTALAPQAIAETLGKPVSTVRNLLRKMADAGAVVQPKYGIYTTLNHRCVDSVDSSPQESTESTESMNLRLSEPRFLPTDDEHCRNPGCRAPLYQSQPGGLCRTCYERIAS